MSMSEEAKKAQREYMKNWRAKNKDKVARYNYNFRTNFPEKVKAAQQRYWEKRASEVTVK